MFAMRVLLILFTLLTFASGIAAQSSQPCAQISIESVEKADAGTPVFFTVRTGNLSSSENLTYRWQISVGTITSGQASSRISVDTTGLGDQVIEATVEVTGRDWNCSVTSKPVDVTGPPRCGAAFDAYGDIKWYYEKARLDNFAIQLLNQPSVRGALFTFAGNPTYKGEAAFRLNRATDYLVKVRNIRRERLITTDAGYRSDLMTYMWIVPEGVPPPVLESDIPLSEVRFTKPKPNAKRKSIPHRRSN